MEQNKTNIFDILRAIAMFMIFCTHNISVLPSFVPNIIYPSCFYTPAWAGCWIFFILFGYLLGKGFYSNKYDISSWKGFLTFYVRRLFRIVPLYIFFLLLVICFINLDVFFHKSFIDLITFRFNGETGIVAQTGALWFVSTIVQLYLLAPFVYKFILSKIKIPYLFILFVIFGLALRLYQYNQGMDWKTVTYVAWYSNLDLFFGGMCLNVISERFKQINIKQMLSISLKIISSFLLLVLIVKNTEIYSLVKSEEDIYFFQYAYIAPTLYLILTSLIILAYEPKEKVKYAPITFKNMLKNPVRFIEGFGVISFSFYLFHSTILITFAKYFVSLNDAHYNIFNIVRINFSKNMNIILHEFIYSFIFCVILSFLIYNFFEKQIGKIQKQIGQDNGKG